MNYPLILLAVVAPAFTSRLSAQEIRALDLVTESKQRILRIETLIPAPLKEVWKAFSTEEGLKKWAAPVVALDLRNGGSLATNYDKSADFDHFSAARIFITFKVKLTASFSEKVRAEDGNLQEIIQLVPAPGGATKVVSSMVGWGEGKEWDDTYAFFAKGNLWTYKQLLKSFPEKAK